MRRHAPVARCTWSTARCRRRWPLEPAPARRTLDPGVVMTRLGLLAAGFRRHWLRLLLTGLSIVVAFVLFSYLMAIRKSFAMGVEVAGRDRLVVRHKVSIIQLLPTSYEAELERIPGVVD